MPWWCHKTIILNRKRSPSYFKQLKGAWSYRKSIYGKILVMIISCCSKPYKYVLFVPLRIVDLMLTKELIKDLPLLTFMIVRKFGWILYPWLYLQPICDSLVTLGFSFGCYKPKFILNLIKKIMALQKDVL